MPVLTKVLKEVTKLSVMALENFVSLPNLKLSSLSSTDRPNARRTSLENPPSNASKLIRQGSVYAGKK